MKKPVVIAVALLGVWSLARAADQCSELFETGQADTAHSDSDADVVEALFGLNQMSARTDRRNAADSKRAILVPGARARSLGHQELIGLNPIQGSYRSNATLNARADLPIADYQRIDPTHHSISQSPLSDTAHARLIADRQIDMFKDEHRGEQLVDPEHLFTLMNPNLAGRVLPRELLGREIAGIFFDQTRSELVRFRGTVFRVFSLQPTTFYYAEIQIKDRTVTVPLQDPILHDALFVVDVSAFHPYLNATMDEYVAEVNRTAP